MAIKAYHAMQYSTYILTDVLMYKVLLYIVMSQCAVFWWAGQCTNNEWNYTSILHMKSSNKWFIIQML